ncbi:MAG: opacity protein-like surface antigen [Glaciecola sp.]|jgi:opacity protein-like surface antigen
MLLNKKFICGLFLAAGVSAQASADWNAGIAYSHFQDDEDEIDISLDGVTLSVGYEFVVEDSKFSFMPELRLGFGVGDDNISEFETNISVEIETYYGFTARGTYHASPNFYIFLQPSYVNLEVKASSMGMSATEDDWETGFGGGVGFVPMDNFMVEAIFEDFDGTNAISAGIRYSF